MSIRMYAVIVSSLSKSRNFASSSTSLHHVVNTTHTEICRKSVCLEEEGSHDLAARMRKVITKTTPTVVAMKNLCHQII